MKTKLALLLLAAAPAAFALEPSWGRVLPGDRDARWTVSYGSLLHLGGHVHETFRAFYKATGQDAKQALAESYSLSDFGVDAPYTTYGVHYEKQWEWFAFRWDLVGFGLDAETRAKRDYYLGLGDDISYRGRSYDHLKIPSGSDFSIDFDGGMTTLVGAFTPFALRFGDDVRLSPEVDIGLVLIGGRYTVDAGSPRGTAVYQNPPVDFVVGGKSSSFSGAGAPMAGLGGELRIGPEDWVQWVFRANLGYFSYSGSTKPFTSSKHRAKDLDLDYFSLAFDASVILPMDEATCLTLGVRLQYMDIDASIKSKEKDAAAVVAARERFDKAADFKALSAFLYAGVTF